MLRRVFIFTINFRGQPTVVAPRQANLISPSSRTSSVQQTRPRTSPLSAIRLGSATDTQPPARWIPLTVTTRHSISGARRVIRTRPAGSRTGDGPQARGYSNLLPRVRVDDDDHATIRA